MPKKALDRKLPIKRQKFVEALVGPANGNQTEAARMAGYEQPRMEGSRLMTFDAVQKAVEERLARAEKLMAADEARARLSLMAAGAIPTKVIKGMTPKGPVRRVEYDAESATSTVLKMHGLLKDQETAPVVNQTQINVLAMLDGMSLEQLRTLHAVAVPVNGSNGKHG